LDILSKSTREVRDGEMEFVAKERQRVTSKIEKDKKTLTE